MEITRGELLLTDLVEPEMLQKIQDSFSAMTGIASLTTDVNGVPVTVGSYFSDFCAKYTRLSEKGRRQCEQCDRMGAEMALKRGRSCAYYCHAGLVDFAAPIMAGNHMVGCFIGGQVLTVSPDEEKVREMAEKLGIDPDDYVEAAGKVKIISKEKIDRTTTALYNIANVLSEIAYSKYEVTLKNLELEKASQLKSDFLANMSHEIRTPMNAVIGMAEMAMREELPERAREYISQIKASGQTLLTIINDILDFSKIESGKMDILPVEYEPMSMVNDMANIIMTRIGNKELELTMDVNPDLPHELYGDNIRIKQIMVNIANNAVKFTRQGCVHLKVDFAWLDEENIELQVAVADTGSGIKQEDMEKLFQSFQQLDSKRNRNVEGTGLGLAICKQLLTLMGGKIHVESEFGKGSTFSFTVPQRVVKKTPSIERTEKRTSAAGLLQNPYIMRQAAIDMERMGVAYTPLASEEEIQRLAEDGPDYLFVEQPLLTEGVQEFLREHQDITGIVLVNFRSAGQYDLPNVLALKKPLYSLNLADIIHEEDIYTRFAEMDMEDFDFIAPDAEVLIVDDNAINLTVAKGLLEPLEMRIDMALSGKEAVGKITDKRYDIVFMDHMMPEMDGVETTRVIRRLLGENGQIPIIALTANAVDGTREMFISEGMNDFVAKPIEMKTMISKLKKWLPKEKLLKRKKKKDRQEVQQSNISIKGLDVSAALRLVGSERLFWSVLREYYRVIDKKHELIRQYEREEDWQAYTIEVHSLKSASRQIGATELADMAELMEAAGNACDAALIHEMNDGMLERYRHYQEILEPYFREEETQQTGDKPPVKPEELAAFFAELQKAMDDLDIDAMEEIVTRMREYSYGTGWQEYFDKLTDAVEDIDTEMCEEIIKGWRSRL